MIEIFRTKGVETQFRRSTVVGSGLCIGLLGEAVDANFYRIIKRASSLPALIDALLIRMGLYFPLLAAFINASFLRKIPCLLGAG
jgi:hypothetical protein